MSLLLNQPIKNKYLDSNQNEIVSVRLQKKSASTQLILNTAHV